MSCVWGAGGAQLTPEQIAERRKLAQIMMQEGGDYSPIQHWTQGINRVAQGMLGGLEARDADSAEKANAAVNQQLIQEMLGGGSATAAGVPGTAPAVAAPMGAPPEHIATTIDQVATATGADPAYLKRLAMVESGGNPNAQNPHSSAGGLFQFLDSTAKQYGLTNKKDPIAAVSAAARLTADNKAALTASLGREPTPGELYLAHQQGAGGASKLLANPNAPAVALVGNGAIRLNGGNPNMTAGQFAQKWTSKFGDLAPMMAAASHPAASDRTRQIAQLMIQQQQAANKTSTVDLGNAIGVMDARGNLIRQLPKGEPVKGPEFGIISEDEMGNKQYGWRDPRTKEVTPFKPQGAAAPSAPATVTGPGGVPIPIPAGVDRKKFVGEVTSATADAAVGKKTEVQANSESFANRMESANGRATELEQQGTSYLGKALDAQIPFVGGGVVPFGNSLQSKEYQQFRQSKSQFITALLRRESGAAISPSEFERYDQEFFPQPGDKPEVIEQKRDARRVAIEAMKKGAGPGYKPPTTAPAKGATSTGVPWSVVE